MKEKLKQALEKTWLKISLIVGALIIVSVVGLGIADATLYANKIHRNVSVGGLSLGGQTKDAAADNIGKLAKELEGQDVNVLYTGKKWVASPAKLGVEVDVDATLERAFALGRTGSVFKDTQTRMSLWFNKRALAPVFDNEDAKFDAFISKVAKEVDQAAEDAEIKIVEGNVVIASSKNGLTVVRNVLEPRILTAFGDPEKQSVLVPVKTQKPDIHEDTLSETKNTVAQMIDAPLELTYKQENWTITEEQIIDWISFKKVREGAVWSLDVDFDSDKAALEIEKLTANIASEPKDAQFEIAGDTVTIVPSENGVKVDVKKAIEGMLEASKTSDNRQAMLATEVAEPKLTTEDAKGMGIKEKVSSYTTHYSASQTSRVHNIKTLAGELDGVILAPDETFSFNGKIGPRTASKGYQEAPAIINGELQPSLGGGVCQVATTLFNTVFFGGYEVVERSNHSLFISHYPTGRDATVSYGGPDLKFKNNTEYYMLIKANASSSTLTINFYSTSRGVEVAYTTSAPSNYKTFPTKYEDDVTLVKGVTKVKDHGSPGRDVTVRRITKIDGKVVKEEKFFSRYKPKTAVIRVGTKEAAITPQPEKTPPSTPPTTQPPAQISEPRRPVPAQPASQ
ncbi:MAG: VanW family protein [Candidatus Aquicultor sp.]|nr:VanW family protein [Candidatus Aquicultor sp.]